ncbi:nuclear matrix constituent protein 1-like isoform X1 [Solanum lycopersicum]|uniref:nuclear matrix constituent protein 1-like isoform X1 n=2 Tax=Solanum lycopersicum TaxID=4081 RepID=UPI000276855D|nr:protein CROWDED NUCLEI 1-like [Solanum lycopersicum]
MSTPPRKVFSGWTLTPRTDLANKTVSKGKDVVFMGSGQKVLSSIQDYDTVDKVVLLDKVSKLENELVDYQYNMGLLLIEKKEWSAKLEEIKQALSEANEAYRREHTAHLIALSEVEKREENLRKALGVENQCVRELEKELREMRSQYAETKYVADSKLDEAKALATSVEENSLHVELKLRAADAKTAEVSRKSSDVERKMRDIEAQENALRRERSSFNTEREAHESAISKHREELREWERKLKEGEERLADARTLLNQREQRANENDGILRQKQSDLEDEQRKIDIANSVLRKKEVDMSSRLAILASKEKELEDVRKSLEIKKEELDELQEKLNAKEREEIQKLMDEHRAILKSKEEEFELEMRQRHASLDEELENKVIELEKKEAEVGHIEEKLKKREQALEKKSDKMKEKEKDLELKLKALKEREKSLKIDERELETEKKQIFTEKDRLLDLRVELENRRAELEKQQLKINEGIEQLKITEDEKMEHARLQSELKQEIDKCRDLRDTLLNEAEDLKQEKERFEREWEELDEKRSAIKKELQEVNDSKKKFEKLQHTEEERLKKEKLETENYVQRELEALKVAQETFAATMDHERSVLSEKTQSEKIRMLHDFEKQKRDLESEMQRKREEMESALHEQKKRFEEERQRELSNANYLREVAHKEMEVMKSERVRLEHEKQEISSNKMHLVEQQSEMKKDIDVLDGLSRKLKDQREAFAKERERFLAFVKKQENCSSCGEGIRIFELSDLQPLNDVVDLEAPSLRNVAQEYLTDGFQDTPVRANNELLPGALNSGSMASAGTMSWLRKCTTKLLKFSPGKKIEHPASQDLIGGSSPEEKFEGELPDTMVKKDQVDLAISIKDTFDDQKLQTDNSVREVEVGKDVPEDSQHSNRNSQRRPVRKGRGKNSKTGHTNSKATSAKIILGENVKESENILVNGGFETSINVNESQKEDSSLFGEAPSKTRKRTRIHGTASEFDGSHSDGQSDSVTTTSRRKRRQKAAPSVQAPGEKRYNLRHPRSAAVATANGSLPELVSKSQEENGDSKVVPETPAAISDGELRNSDAALPAVADSPLIEAADDQACAGDIANELVDDTGLSEEINGTPEGPSAYNVYDEEHEGDTIVQEEDGERDEDADENDELDEGNEEEEVPHPGEVSIGKKIWSFITT